MFPTMDALTGLRTILQVSLFCFSLQIVVFSLFETISYGRILYNVEGILHDETLAIRINIFILARRVIKWRRLELRKGF